MVLKHNIPHYLPKSSNTYNKLKTNDYAGEILKTIYINETLIQMLAPNLEPLAWHFPGIAFLFVTCFSEPMGGTPLDRCWPPLGHPCFDFLDLLEEFRSRFAQNVKNPEQHLNTSSIDPGVGIRLSQLSRLKLPLFYLLYHKRHYRRR